MLIFSALLNCIYSTSSRFLIMVNAPWRPMRLVAENRVFNSRKSLKDKRLFQHSYKSLTYLTQTKPKNFEHNLYYASILT